MHQSSEGEGEGAKRAAAWREARASERERRRQRGAREREEKKLLRLGATGASAAERAVGAVARVVNQCRAHAESRAPCRPRCSSTPGAGNPGRACALGAGRRWPMPTDLEPLSGFI